MPVCVICKLESAIKTFLITVIAIATQDAHGGISQGMQKAITWSEPFISASEYTRASASLRVSVLCRAGLFLSVDDWQDGVCKALGALRIGSPYVS